MATSMAEAFHGIDLEDCIKVGSSFTGGTLPTSRSESEKNATAHRQWKHGVPRMFSSSFFLWELLGVVFRKIVKRAKFRSITETIRKPNLNQASGKSGHSSRSFQRPAAGYSENLVSKRGSAVAASHTSRTMAKQNKKYAMPAASRATKLIFRMSALSDPVAIVISVSRDVIYRGTLAVTEAEDGEEIRGLSRGYDWAHTCTTWHRLYITSVVPIWPMS